MSFSNTALVYSKPIQLESGVSAVPLLRSGRMSQSALVSASNILEELKFWK